MATRLLAQPVRGQVEDIYALVRLADEIVDGVATSAGLTPQEVAMELDGLEAETERAMACGYSTNLVVHAFAQTARRVGVGNQLTRPFFASMRADITQGTHDATSLSEYIYGSAEVVGIMCLDAFLADGTFAPAERERFVTAARALGAAFQKVNFLRDLRADVDDLGRSYFPELVVAALTDVQKLELVADIEGDLATAREMIPHLPATSRRAVFLAERLFSALNRRIARTPAAVLKNTRVRVPNGYKVVLVARAVMGRIRY